MSFLDPVLAAPTADWILRTTRDSVVATIVETAFDRKSRNRGLLGRSSLPDERALIIAPCSSIHTFFMQFPIDVAFVARDGQIVRARQALGPWRLQMSPGAFAVVELAAGTLRRTGTRVGDYLRLTRE